ncbi:MAG TPA: gliding motility-associated C-terminal domain-containing protein [Bacteroidia bacterium]|nr:gliding motility-associated C-terminal domain-containing protein [Bacteroidia bacterium]
MNPLPKIIFLGDNLTFCDGTTTSIPLKSNVNGTTFSWTAVQTDVAGAFADSNKVAIEQLLKLTSNKSGTVVYTVTAHSPALCASGSNRDFLVKVTPLDDASFSYSSAKYCQEEMDPAAIITGALGVFDATPAGLLFSDQTNGIIDLSASVPGTYKVSYNTGGFCPQQHLEDITINATPTANTSSISANGSHCGTKTGSVTGITNVTGANPLLYEWKDANGNIVGTNLILDSVPPGSYVLKIIDGNGCSTVIGNGNSITIKNEKTVFADFVSDITLGDTPLIVQFTNKSTGTVVNYNWNFDNGTSSTQKNPLITLNDVKVHKVCLMIDDGKNECRDTVCRSIEVFDALDLRILPNIFTPNGDGVNDVFKITATGIASVHAEVYNRWGQKEYEWNTIEGGWDGRSATGLQAPDGTYYVILFITSADKNKTVLEPIKQSFTLLR